METERLEQLLQVIKDSKVTGAFIPSHEIAELVKAYQYHLRVLPLHNAIHEACQKLGM